MDRVVEAGFAVCAWAMALVLIMCVFAIPIVLVDGPLEDTRKWQQEAIKHGAAAYNSQTGEFYWIDSAPAPVLDEAPAPQ